jgi:hypothetical protein
MHSPTGIDSTTRRPASVTDWANKCLVEASNDDPRALFLGMLYRRSQIFADSSFPSSVVATQLVASHSFLQGRSRLVQLRLPFPHPAVVWMDRPFLPSKKPRVMD